MLVVVFFACLTWAGSQGRRVKIDVGAPWPRFVESPVVEMAEFLADQSPAFMWQFASSMCEHKDQVDTVIYEVGIDGPSTRSAESRMQNMQTLTFELAAQITPTSLHSLMDTMIGLGYYQPAIEFYRSVTSPWQHIAATTSVNGCTSSEPAAFVVVLPEQTVFCSAEALVSYLAARGDSRSEASKSSTIPQVDQDWEHVFPAESSNGIGGQKVILHGVIGSSAFCSIHNAMVSTSPSEGADSSLASGVHSYAVRHLLPLNVDSRAVSTTSRFMGYGAFLDIKNMEYKNVDDAAASEGERGQQDQAVDNEQDGPGEGKEEAVSFAEDEEVQGVNFHVLSQQLPQQGKELLMLREELVRAELEKGGSAAAGGGDGEQQSTEMKVWNIKNLGLQTMQLIASTRQEKSASEAIRKFGIYVQNFPKFAPMISATKVSADLRDEVTSFYHAGVYSALPMNSLFVNGKRIDLGGNTFNVFDVLRELQVEMALQLKLESVSIPSSPGLLSLSAPNTPETLSSSDVRPAEDSVYEEGEGRREERLSILERQKQDTVREEVAQLAFRIATGVALTEENEEAAKAETDPEEDDLAEIMGGGGSGGIGGGRMAEQIIRIDVSKGGKHAVNFFNNLEKDAQYKSWPKSLRQLLYPSWSIHSIARNMYTFIAVADVLSEEGAGLISQMHMLMAQRYPVRVGAVFVCDGTTRAGGGVETGSNAGGSLRTDFCRLFAHLRKEHGQVAAVSFALSVASSVADLAEERAMVQQMNEIGTAGGGAAVVNAASAADMQIDRTALLSIFSSISQQAGKRAEPVSAAEIMLENTDLYMDFVGNSTQYLRAKGLPKNSFSLNGIVVNDHTIPQNFMQILAREQRLLTEYVRSGQLQDGGGGGGGSKAGAATKQSIFSRVLELNKGGTYARYHSMLEETEIKFVDYTTTQARSFLSSLRFYLPFYFVPSSISSSSSTPLVDSVNNENLSIENAEKGTVQWLAFQASTGGLAEAERSFANTLLLRAPMTLAGYSAAARALRWAASNSADGEAPIADVGVRVAIVLAPASIEKSFGEEGAVTEDACCSTDGVVGIGLSEMQVTVDPDSSSSTSTSVRRDGSIDDIVDSDTLIHAASVGEEGGRDERRHSKRREVEGEVLAILDAVERTLCEQGALDGRDGGGEGDREGTGKGVCDVNAMRAMARVLSALGAGKTPRQYISDLRFALSLSPSPASEDRTGKTETETRTEPESAEQSVEERLLQAMEAAVSDATRTAEALARADVLAGEAAAVIGMTTSTAAAAAAAAATAGSVDEHQGMGEEEEEEAIALVLGSRKLTTTDLSEEDVKLLASLEATRMLKYVARGVTKHLPSLSQLQQRASSSSSFASVVQSFHTHSDFVVQVASYCDFYMSGGGGKAARVDVQGVVKYFSDAVAVQLEASRQDRLKQLKKKMRSQKKQKISTKKTKTAAKGEGKDAELAGGERDEEQQQQQQQQLVVEEGSSLLYELDGQALDGSAAPIKIFYVIDPVSHAGQRAASLIQLVQEHLHYPQTILFMPKLEVSGSFPLQNFYRFVVNRPHEWSKAEADFASLPRQHVLTVRMDVPEPWNVQASSAVQDIDNLRCVGKLCGDPESSGADAELTQISYRLKSLIVPGQCFEVPPGSSLTSSNVKISPPGGLQLTLTSTARSPSPSSDDHLTVTSEEKEGMKDGNVNNNISESETPGRWTSEVIEHSDTLVMKNLGYFQLQASPGLYTLQLAPGRASGIYEIQNPDTFSPLTATTTTTTTTTTAEIEEEQGEQSSTLQSKNVPLNEAGSGKLVAVKAFGDVINRLLVNKRAGMEKLSLLVDGDGSDDSDIIAAAAAESGAGVADAKAEGAATTAGSGSVGVWDSFKSSIFGSSSEKGGVIHNGIEGAGEEDGRIHVFSLATGHLYERLLRIMMLSVSRQASRPVKFWLFENYLSPAFKESAAAMTESYGFEIGYVTYKWPQWLRQQTQQQRIIWGYKILFLDVLFPLNVKKVIYVDADQVVRTDLAELWDMDLQGKPYAYTPFCTSREETLGFQFWRSGYWKDHLRGRPYHISALYVVDLQKFRRQAVGDQLRAVYDQLSRDPNSLANLDQDLPNYAQHAVPIHSLPQEWLWCETWCSDKSKKKAKTIDLCNNPMHKESKLDMARRIISGELFDQSWVELDEEIRALQTSRGLAGSLSSSNANNNATATASVLSAATTTEAASVA